MTIADHLKAWLQLARVSNLPTVWANVVMGIAWGWWCLRKEIESTGQRIEGFVTNTGESIDPGLLWLLNISLAPIVAGTLIYIAGMFMNDALDLEVDRQERPGRPLPSGRLDPRRVLIAAAVLLLGGVAASTLHPVIVVPIAFTVLAALVVLYNLIHRRWSGSVVVMAACRGTLVLAAGLMFFDLSAFSPWRLVAPAVLFAYTLLIAVVARHEVRFARVPLVITLIVAMPLVDAALCLWAGHPHAALFCVACSVLTLIGQRFVKGS